MRSDRQNPIVDKTFAFAIEVVKFCDELESSKKFVVANQLLKSGTSIGALVREAQNAESRADFIHKMKIAAKECDETTYWLQLCKEAYQTDKCAQLIDSAKEITLILSKIISTSKKQH